MPLVWYINMITVIQKNVHVHLLNIYHLISIYFRGQEHKGEEPFRGWFAHIGELRSLCVGIPMLALTATASPVHRRQIMRNLCFKPSAEVIIDSPDRANIKISAMMIKNNADVEDVFQWIIADLHEQRENFPKHLVFCSSIRDCSLVYMVFMKHFGKSNLFDMFHSKTTDAVKDKIRSDMINPCGKLRLLICTDAAGMGVNFSDVHNIVHYGPPRQIDTLVQQMGRAGRDGLQSQEILIYKPLHLRKCDDDVIVLLKSLGECRRQILLRAYMSTSTENITKHNCCDICEAKCSCKKDNCPSSHPAKSFIAHEEKHELQAGRNVSNEDRKIVRHKLVAYKISLSDSVQTGIIDAEIIHGFNSTVIEDILQKLPYLMTVDDILANTLVTSREISEKVISILREVFDDIHVNIDEMEQAMLLFEIDE